MRVCIYQEKMALGADKSFILQSTVRGHRSSASSSGFFFLQSLTSFSLTEYSRPVALLLHFSAVSITFSLKTAVVIHCSMPSVLMKCFNCITNRAEGCMNTSMYFTSCQPLLSYPILGAINRYYCRVCYNLCYTQLHYVYLTQKTNFKKCQELR